MHNDLESIKAAVEAGDLDTARTLSDTFVTANPSIFVDMVNKPVGGEFGLVAAVDTFRQAGMEENQWQVEAWLLHRFEPQNIGGAAEATVRIT